MPKIEILSLSEHEVFDSPPQFSESERGRYFLLPTILEDWLKTMGEPTNQVGFILLWGYCCASSRFFQPAQFRLNDALSICKQQGIDPAKINFDCYAKRTFNSHKQKIRKHLGLMSFDTDAKGFFLKAVRDRAARHQAPKQIMHDVVEILKAKNIEIPGYNRFALAITRSVVDFEKGVSQSLAKNLSSSGKAQLDALIEPVLPSSISVIAGLKNISHSRRPKEIKESLQVFKRLQEQYLALSPAIEAMGLHADTIKYCATWVRKASLHQINQMQTNKRYFYLACFIIHQYQLRQDILADILLTCVQATQNAITRGQKENGVKQSGLQTKAFTLLSAARVSYKKLLEKIEAVAVHHYLDDAEKIAQIKDLLDNYQKQTAETDLDKIEQNTLEQIDAQDYHQLLDGLSLKLQNRVSDIVRHLAFEKSSDQQLSPILDAIQHYQTKRGDIGKDAPIDFLDAKLSEKLWSQSGKFKVSLYKALLFLHIAESLKSGAISLSPAYRYLSLENYLHPKAHWLANSERLLEEAGLMRFADVDQLLNECSRELHKAFLMTNNRILEGQNDFIKFRPDEKMVLTTPRVEKLDTKPVSALFADKKHVSLLEILNEIQRVTNYLDCFNHFSVKSKKVQPKPTNFYAAIMGLGCNLGVSKMANVSKGISEDSLSGLVNWHMSLDNLNDANQRILQFFDRLSLAKIHEIDNEKKHTSSDGRKVGVAVESLNANHSFKYFGGGVGISIYTFIDDLNRLFYSTAFSSSEREAAYVVDGLIHSSSITSSVHSTDTHGYTEAVFGMLHMLGIYFAPRIKNLKKATLYSFESRKTYEKQGCKVIPERYIDVDLIKDHWDDILRLMVTIKLKETTASQIFKRLSSYSKQHPLYCALKEFGRIIKSLFILRYIDDVEFRQVIEKQLNRIELSNKFSKAILFGNNQEIQYASKEEQEMVAACQRLIQNSIVLWNELYLSQKLALAKDQKEQKAILEIIRNGSTLVWQHVNLHGEYDFTWAYEKAEPTFNIEKILSMKIN